VVSVKTCPPDLKKNEPEFMLEFRLKAYRQWQKMTEPTWPSVKYTIDYQDIIYYSRRSKGKLNSLEVDPTLEAFEKLGIPLSAKRLSNVAVDAI